MMASEWAQERLRQWLIEVVDINKRQMGFRIPELLDEVQRETAARCAEIACDVGNRSMPASRAAGAQEAKYAILAEFGLEE